MGDVVRPSASLAGQSQNGLSSRSGRSAQRSAWWEQAADLAARIAATPAASPLDWYRIGDGWLGLGSDNGPFRNRFRTLFGDCAAEPPRDAAPAVRCHVRSISSPNVSLVRFDDPEPLDQMRFARSVLGERSYESWPSPVPGWQLVGTAARPDAPILAATDRELLVSRRGAWQGFVGSLAVNRLLRLQRDTLFFHAAAVAIGGRGVLLIGPKGSGKTTLSLALAARGHAFFGDEIVGVRMPTHALVPVRRSASIREGPRAGALDRALGARRIATDLFPDGTTRMRVPVGTVFPAAAVQPAGLAQILFLRGFAPAASLEPFRPRSHDVRHLSPLACTLWEVPAARRIMQLLALLAGTRCAHIDVGAPEETARVIELTVEA